MLDTHRLSERATVDGAQEANGLVSKFLSIVHGGPPARAGRYWQVSLSKPRVIGVNEGASALRGWRPTPDAPQRLGRRGQLQLGTLASPGGALLLMAYGHFIRVN